MQKAIMKKAEKLSLINYDYSGYYDILERAKASYNNAIGTTMMLIAAICITLISTLTIVGYLSTISLSIVFLLLFVLAIKLVSYKITSRRTQQFREAFTHDMRKNKLLSSYIYIKDTRTLGAMPYFYNKWRTYNREIVDKQFKQEKKNILVALCFDIASFIGYCILLAVVVWKQVNSSSLSIENIVVLLVALDVVYNNIDSIIVQFGNVFSNAYLSKDMFDFLNIKDENRVTYKSQPGNEICLKNVSFKYPNSSHYILRNINLTIKKGETIALVGQNGSGKTTLVKLLCGLYQPSEGSIFYGDGFCLNEGSSELVSAVFQDFNMYCLSLAENVTISDIDNAKDRDRVVEVLWKTAGVDWFKKYADGIDTQLGRAFGGIELSGGEQQRVAISRAFFRHYEIIFLDEPTSALDPVIESEIYRTFYDLTKGKTAIIVSHRLASVKFADRILLLKEGTIMENGTHDELMMLDGEYAKMYMMQKENYVR
jgi:ATP-binding cassette subfamily B protein